MPTNEELIAKAKQCQLPNYKPPPLVLAKGNGRRVEDVEGRSYLDLSGGIAVLSVGHSHPRLADAIATQARRLMHVSNLFYNDQAILLAEQIVKRTVFRRVYFSNSGTEANEAMIKLARRWHYEQGHPERVEIIATHDSFHGRTMGSLAVTGQPKYHVGMGPMMGGVKFVPYNSLEAMRSVVSNQTAAIIVEPVQAEGGIINGEDEYLKGLRKLCDETGALLLFDEVQTGYGRTGRFLCREWSDVVPDACSLAKGIAGGFPLGAMAVVERFRDALPPGSHASTFGGNPLACAAGLAVLGIFDSEDLVKRAETTGAYLGVKLADIVDKGGAVESRGRGLLRGLLLPDDVDPLKTLATIRERGVLLTLAGGQVLRFTPALNITNGEIDEGLEVVRRALADAPRKEA